MDKVGTNVVVQEIAVADNLLITVAVEVVVVVHILRRESIVQEARTARDCMANSLKGILYKIVVAVEYDAPLSFSRRYRRIAGCVCSTVLLKPNKPYAGVVLGIALTNLCREVGASVIYEYVLVPPPITFVNDWRSTLSIQRDTQSSRL